MTIRQLSPVVADAIAAGEVVERPASVVKELVENALDAGARYVVIELEGAGLERITVSDDGAGIPAAELPLALTRHATSKLSEVADLAAVGSLGFRGEALASIAAVSRVECRSAFGAEPGATVEVEHGEIGAVAPAPPVPGTRVEVRGLFENTPARRSFLKRPATEVAAAVRVVAALALCHPRVGFRMTVDGRRTLDIADDSDIDRRFRAMQRGAGAVLPVDGGRGTAAVRGVIGEPNDCRRTREHLFLAVNGRPVVNRSLAFAVEQSYRGLVEPGRFPIGALEILLPADQVDVNVHPTKREVRFRDEGPLFGMVQEGCLAALSASRAYAGSGLFEGGAGPGDRDVDGPTGAVVAEGSGAYAGGPAVAVAEKAVSVQLGISQANETSVDPRPLLRGPFHLIGQVMDCYIVAEGPTGLVLVDQHAAHERILFNQLQAARDGGVARQLQPMLVPALLQLTPVQAACLREARQDLADAGLVVEDFGGESARLVAHDPRLPFAGLDRMTLDVLDTLVAERREVDLTRRLERTTYTVACHAAIKFGQRLAHAEMESLLRELEVADPGITCPHGRPTMLEITEAQLRREFRRS